MGGFDIFRSVLKDTDNNGWTDPENMGFPVNTVSDDIFFCLSEDGRTGYFSSERPGGLGGQDIHIVEFPSSQLEYLVVCGLVTDASEEPVRARITLWEGDDGEVAGVFNTNERTGRYVMVVEPGSTYSMVVEAKGFDTRTSRIKAGNVLDDDREMSMDIVLVRNERTARILKE
jgi:hypothetical protein